MSNQPCNWIPFSHLINRCTFWQTNLVFCRFGMAFLFQRRYPETYLMGLSLSFNILCYLLHKNSIVSTSIFLQIDSDWSLLPRDRLSLGVKIDWKAEITVYDKICKNKTNQNFFEFSWDYFHFISVGGNYSAKKFCWKFTLDIQYSNDYLFFFYPFSIHFKFEKKISSQTNILMN